MTSANISLEKKIFHRVENVVKQLVHTSAMRSSRYEARGKFREHSRSQSCSRLRLEQLLRIFRALQTSRVLHISMNAQLMNAQLRLEQLLRIFRALQTSQVLHISTNAQLTYEPLFYNIFNPVEIFFPQGMCLLTSWACTIGIWSTLALLNLSRQILLAML